jgi:hypothetical protein
LAGIGHADVVTPGTDEQDSANKASRGTLRALAFFGTLFLPGTFLYVCALMYPLVLNNSLFNFYLTILLLLTPVASLAALLMLRAARYYWSIAGVFVLQLALEAWINNWLGL